MITPQTTLPSTARQRDMRGLTISAEAADQVNTDALADLLGSTARLDVALYIGLTCRICHTTLPSPHSSPCPLLGSHNNQRPLDALIPGDQSTAPPTHIRVAVEHLTGHTLAQGNTPTARAQLRRWARRTATQNHPA